MKTKKQRLDLVRKTKNLKYADLIGDESVVTADNLRVTVARENDKIDYYLRIIAKKHNISEHWLLTGEGNMDADKIDQKPEAKFSDKPFVKEVIVIPAKAQLGLTSNFYADEMMQDLEKRQIHVEKDYKGKYYDIECTGDSMNDGTRRSICEGDSVLCREISKTHWKNKFHINKWEFVFFHNERGILIKQIKEHIPETGEMLLCSYNPDKEEYPDFTINVRDCYAICNVVQVVQNR